MSKGLADVLLQEGLIDEEALRSAAAAQVERGLSLGKALIEVGAVTEQQIVAAVARQIGIPFADTGPGAVDPDAAALLPRALATQL
ncbi:MAG: type II secretion system protein GspE, partial [Actinomycetota bacterium]|nr:type II secretion system protein GspE [Actinomycetota bacterium]